MPHIDNDRVAMLTLLFIAVYYLNKDVKYTAELQSYFVFLHCAILS